MSPHKNVLKLLMPLEIGGDFDADIEIEGSYLDAVQERAEDLLNDMFPDTTYDLLSGWERVCGITPAADDTLQKRRDVVTRKLRERGGLSRAYFVALAATMSYTITIEEMQPFRTGVNRAGDTIYVDDVIFIWRVNISGQSLYYFRVGQSAAGERLLSWDAQTVLEGIFNDLKPAHTFIIFDYS